MTYDSCVSPFDPLPVPPLTPFPPETIVETLVQSRLEDLSNQCRTLMMRGDRETAEILHREALELAATADQGVPFLALSLRT